MEVKRWLIQPTHKIKYHYILLREDISQKHQENGGWWYFVIWKTNNYKHIYVCTDED